MSFINQSDKFTFPFFFSFSFNLTDVYSTQTVSQQLVPQLTIYRLILFVVIVVVVVTTTHELTVDSLVDGKVPRVVATQHIKK